MSDPRESFARHVVEEIRRRGHLAYWAGGCVRDLLLGSVPSDYDVATDARPDVIARIFPRSIGVGVAYGVVRVIGPRGSGEVEVATFRSDGTYGDGRRPDSVRFGDPRNDALRRDFTINGMFLDPTTGEVLDFVGGREDLAEGRLRAIGDPHARFAEDKLRLLRAIRFAARFGLRIEAETFAAIRATAPDICRVSVERIAQELRKMLADPARAKAVELAGEAGVLWTVLPRLEPLRGLHPAGPKSTIPDAWILTLRVLGNLSPDCPSTPAFAALLHLAGLATLREGPLPDRDPAAISGDLAEDSCRALKLSNDERSRIAWLVRNQAAPDRPQRLSIAGRKRLLSTEGIDDLLEFHRARALAGLADRATVPYWQSYREDEPDGPIDPPALIRGDDLIAAGYPPGPAMKGLLERIRDAQLEGTIRTPEEALSWIRAQAGEGAPPGGIP